MMEAFPAMGEIALKRFLLARNLDVVRVAAAVAMVPPHVPS
jgi:hypothetical protein